MKHGLWRMIITAICLAVCMAVGAACASEAADAPYPEIEDLSPVMLAGEDLTFRFYAYGELLPGRPVSYEIRINGGETAYATLTKTGKVIIPWTALSGCGSEATISVRACGEGYIPQEESGTVRIIEATAGGPAVTFTSLSDDGAYWLDEEARVWIDATDATELYIKKPNGDAFETLHTNYYWDNVYEWDEYNWGVDHERVNLSCWLFDPGAYTVEVLAYMPAPTDDDPDAMAWKMSTGTIRVEAKGQIADPGVTVGGLDENGCIMRGEVLDVSVTMSTGRNFYLGIYAADEDGEIIETEDEEDLFGYKYGYESCECAFSTMEMPAGNYVLNVSERRDGYIPGETNIPFTVVTGEGFTLPEEPVWTLSKNSVDTEEPFDVSVYIPADDTQFGTPWTELWIVQDDEYAVGNDSQGNFCALRNVTLHSDEPVTFTAYRSYPNGGDVRITYTGQFTVKPATDAPTPKVTGLDTTHLIGEDLTFTIGIEEGEEDKLIAGKPLKYEVWLEGHNYIFDHAGSITIPWEGFVTEYNIPYPGEKVNLYIRAFGQGYNEKEIRKEVVLYEAADEDFRIAFAGTDEEHIRLVVRQKYTLLVQLPDDTTGIESIQIYTDNSGWGYDSFTPASLPAGGIRTGYMGEVRDNSPVMARYTKTDGTIHYSNILLVDYYNLGPLPELQVTTNLTMTDGAYHVSRGDFILAAVGNPAAFAGKGEQTVFRVRIEDRSEGYDQEVESNEKAFDGIYTEVCVPTGELEVREEPYYLVATISTRDNVWEDSTVEFPLYVDGDAEMFEGVLITATKTEAETHETIHIQVSAPEAQSVEIFNGSKEDGYSIEEYSEEYACITRSFGAAGSECFWARAYYRDGTTADSDVLEIHVTAPYGDLEDVLTVSAPVQVQAHQPFTVRTVSRNTDDPVIPDRLRVSLSPYGGGWNDDEYTAVQTGEVTVPATNGDGDWRIEAGQLYNMTVEVFKQGYSAASFSRTIYAPDAEQTNNAVLTVNGKTTGVTLENGTNYTVSVTGLPEGVTCVAILDVGGSGWNLAYPEEGATSATRDDISLHTRQEQAEIYALFTTFENAGAYFAHEIPWDGCTNIVPVTITCSHTSTMTTIFWDRKTYTANGKMNHLITGHGEKWRVCEDCGAKLELLEEVTSVGQPHSFYEGECELCGFVCQHEAEDVAHASYMEDGSVITAEDNKYMHHIQGTRVEYDWCTNCGMNLGETRTQVDAYEKHEYDAAYHCDVCGYEAPDNYLNVSYTDGCQEYMNVQPGTDVTLGVTAESSLSDELNYQWCWYDAAQDPGNGTYVPIVGATQPTFTLENCGMNKDLYVMVDDGYVHYEQYFHVRIENGFNVSCAVDTPVMVPINGTAELRVSAYCRDGILTYRWLRGVRDENGAFTYEPIPNSDSPVLTTSPITQAENYRCQVYDQYGNNGVVEIEVRVNSHLKVTANGGTNASAAPGGETTMSVTATSDYPGQITYQWSREVNGDWGSYYENVPGATGPSLTVSDVREHRTYRVDVTDGYMEDYLYFSVIVDSQMDAYIDGDNRVTADYGTPVTFSVKATDMFDGAGITYRWYMMRTNPGSYDQYAEELGYEADLEIPALYPGVIYCDVRNEYGMMTLGVRLDVDTHLTADTESHEYKVPYGDPMLLTVNAAGLKNTLSYTWYSEKEDGSDWQEIPGETGSTLQIDAVTEPLVYSCRVDDGVNTYGVNQILVEPDTQLTVEPVSPTAFAVTGEPVTMSVSVNSLREPEAITCSWYRFDWATGESEEIEGADGTSLTVTPTGPARYRCQVTDGLDIKHADFLTCTESVTDHYNQNSEYRVNYGTVVKLRVSAASPDGPAAYQWRHGDTVLAGETGPTLTVTATENTYYSCDVRFGNSTEIYDTERFYIRIRNEVTIDRTNDRSLWVIPQEGLTLTVNAASRDGSELRYKWYKNGYVIPDETGSSLTVAYETMCGLIHYSCNVSDVYGNDEQDAYFNCFSGEPETMQAGTTVTCTGDERFLRFTPAASAVYTMTLTGTVYDAIIYPANGEQSFLLWPDEPREIRLQGGLDYYIRLTEGHTLTVALKQEEQETYAFSLRRNDRIRVPDLTLNGRDYPLTNLVSGDPSVVYVNGDAIRALKTGQATVTATYQGGVATRVFTITVANGPVLKLPYDLNEIRADAFAGDTGLRFIELGYSVQNVRRGAFANTGSVTVYVNGYNTAFEDGAFTGSSPVILCENGSPAAMYCSEKGLLYFRME